MRRDENEPALVQTARALGVQMEQFGPLDWWAYWPRQGWVPVEIKRPEREGRKGEYTPAQILFFSRCKQRGSRYLTWRTEKDVLDFVGARRSA